MNTISSKALKAVLILLGIYGIFLSIDFGVGGITSLGWQGETEFLLVTNEARYGVQDSNFRFFGGGFGVIGVLMIMSATNLKKYQEILNLMFRLIFVSGLMRFTSGNIALLSSAELSVAIFIEIVLMIVLCF
ncbi:MAG: DUF4345 family protein [Anaerolineae bacterium]|nr:DUF4345 family protein [Anaerolineae bacterium]